MPKFVVVLVTCPGEIADSLASHLVKEELAACVNVIEQVTSFYKWKGELCKEREFLLIIKTRDDLFERLRARVKELHPYDVPEIIAIPIEHGHQQYLDWLNRSLVKADF